VGQLAKLISQSHVYLELPEIENNLVNQYLNQAIKRETGVKLTFSLVGQVVFTGGQSFLK